MFTLSPYKTVTKETDSFPCSLEKFLRNLNVSKGLERRREQGLYSSRKPEKLRAGSTKYQSTNTIIGNMALLCEPG